jgi:lipopolysaccharide transport system ATP-binding protein
MSPLAVEAVGLGKQYRVGEVESGFARLRHGMRGRRTGDAIWALKDASFSVTEGERVGIVGRNGAGKSTLLKLLSRITEPTSGYADIRGRVGALLEVGTGFHPDLTGRENVYLNGAILGMRKAEVRRKFRDIVEFSGVERHIDTPVRWYSSGMYVRLAFSVAAHLEPEILIVDEVLAVGDAEFQRRCLARMSEVALEGRTVLFVSHNMQAIRRLCDRAILLDRGHLISDGDAESIAGEYLASVGGLEGALRRWDDPAEQPGDNACRLVEIAVVDEHGEPAATVFSSKPSYVTIAFDLDTVHPAFNVGFELTTPDGVVVFNTFFRDGASTPQLAAGRNVLRCPMPRALLNTGRYLVNLRISLHNVRWIVNEDAVIQFDVLADHGESLFLHSTTRGGVIAPALEWQAEPRAEDPATGALELPRVRR